MDGTIIVDIPVKQKKRGLFKRHIEIEYRKQGFTFDMFAWAYMSNYTQLALSEFGLLNERFIDVSYYCAAYSYCRNNNLQVDFTEDTVTKWFSDMSQKTAQSILNCMLQSKVGGESIQDLIIKSLPKEDEKKK